MTYLLMMVFKVVKEQVEEWFYQGPISQIKQRAFYPHSKDAQITVAQRLCFSQVS